MTANRTLEQQRVEAALERVLSVPESVSNEYRSLAQGFPAMLVSSGLAPALAFLEARAARGTQETNAAELLSKHIATWVLENSFGESAIGDKPTQLCLKKLAQVDSLRYRLAEQEAVQLAVWLKRFAQAYLKSA